MNALSRLLARFTVLRWLALMLSLPAVTHAAGPTGQLNDTGISDCTGIEADSGTLPRQDCRYGRDAAAAMGSMPKVGGGGKGFDFTKIANDGSPLRESAALGAGATDWACTKDNVTNLIWEVKTTSGLRSQSHSYTWYSSDSSTNGGSVGTSSGGVCFATGRCDTEKFVADVNAVGLCGASTWRMPTIKELESIADLGRYYPPIDPNYFPNTPASYFWSTSASAIVSDYAWYVHFEIGDANHLAKNAPMQVRLVRAGQ